MRGQKTGDERDDVAASKTAIAAWSKNNDQINNRYRIGFVCKLLDMRAQPFLFIRRAGGQGGQASIVLPLPFMANRHTCGGKSFVLL